MIAVTSAQLSSAAPSGNAVIIKAIADNSERVFAKYGLTNRNRVLGFLSTALEESGFLRLSENLNYSAQRAHEVWPARFPTVASAEPYAMQPRALANVVYGDRMGNSAPGDGYKYRGQGLLQITGRDNFALLEKITGLPLVAQPDLVTSPEHMLECSVAMFVQYRDILTYCDKEQWPQVWALVGTGRATGSAINPANHQAALDRLQKAIPALVEAPVPATPLPAPTPPVSAPPPPDVPKPADPVPAPEPGFWSRLWSALTGIFTHRTA